MAHQIETHEGKAAFVSAREDAWHKLGTVLPDTFDAATALKVAHLADWNVRKEPMKVHLPDGTVLDTDNAFGSIRTSPFTGEPEYLGPVGSIWTPIQNEEHCELLDAVVDESGAHYETAGSLKGGKEVFVTMELPDHMSIGGIDKVKTYISALNHHDGRGAFKFLVGHVRIVCANTQAAAIHEAKSSFTVRHTKNHAQAMSTAREALGLTFKNIEGFQQEAEKMIQQTMTEGQFWDIVKDLTGDPEKAKGAAATTLARQQSQLMHLFTDSPTATEIRGTRWAGYQAVTEYVDFFSPVRTKGDVQEARALRALGEVGVGLKTRAFDLLAV